MSDRFSVYNEVEDRGFFFYSGADGDLCRKHGLAGWRLSLSVHSYRIQKKSEHFRNSWNTVFRVESGEGHEYTREQKKRFLAKVDELIEEGALEVAE